MLVDELGRIGIESEADADSIRVRGGAPGVPQPARIRTYDDHRMAMAFAVAGSRVPGIVIEDATGMLRVVLPDTLSALPGVPVGTRFLAQGLLRQTPEGPVVDAREWLYDSTAVPVRSP